MVLPMKYQGVGSVCGVYVCTYTHTLYVGYLDVSPGVGSRHLKGPNSRWTKSRHTCIRTCVQRRHVYEDAGRQDDILD